MAGYTPRKGRMNAEDESRIRANEGYIEQVVDGRNLAGFLFDSRAINNKERDTILGEHSSRQRTQKMIGILLQKGPDAYKKFLDALNKAKYGHVAKRIRETKVTTNQRNPDSSVEDSRSSPALQNPDKNLMEQLQTKKRQCESLTLRMTELREQLVTPGENSGDTAREQRREEFDSIQDMLTKFNKDTDTQIGELMSDNTQKDAIIEDLKVQLVQKTGDLQIAERKIEELEKSMRQQKMKYKQFLKETKDKMKQQDDKMKQQDDKMKQQDDKIKQQEVKLKKTTKEHEDTMKSFESRLRSLESPGKDSSSTTQETQKKDTDFNNSTEKSENVSSHYETGSNGKLQDQFQRQATSASPRNHRNSTKETQKSDTSFNPVTRTSQNMSTIYTKSTNKKKLLPPIDLK